jgi:prepilin-type N-terminal cleavage/methylation domain-containing protein
MKISGQKGFSLVELLVAVAIFSVVMAVVADVFVSGMGGARKVFGEQSIQESGRFILESVSKELRMSQLDSADGTAHSSLPDGAVLGPYSEIEITNGDGEVVIYEIDNSDSVMQIKRNGTAISPNDVKVTGYFWIGKVTPVSGGDPYQTRFYLTLKIKNKLLSVFNSEINISTMVVSREFSPPY